MTQLADTVLFADVGPGPLLVPMAGSVAVAGVFLFLALGSGGVWLVRRSRHQPASSPRRIFLLSLGAACVCGAFTPAIIGLFAPPLLAVALVLFLTGAVLAILGARTPRDGQVPAHPDDTDRDLQDLAR